MMLTKLPPMFTMFPLLTKVTAFNKFNKCFQGITTLFIDIKVLPYVITILITWFTLITTII